MNVCASSGVRSRPGRSRSVPRAQAVGRRLPVIFLLLALDAGAQQGTSGTLTGIVTMDGTPVAGVQVTVTSPSLQASLQARTGATGRYYFPRVPPGECTLEFAGDGVQTLRQVVLVRLSQTTEADTSLTRATFEESVTVVAPYAATSRPVDNFSADVIEALPHGRSIRDTALLSTLVTPNSTRNRITVGGAQFWTSVYLLDGAVVTDTLGAQPHDLFIEDAMEESSVAVSAVSAEYGRFTGGTVSVLTKSGGNTISGSFRVSLSNPSWTARTPWRDEAAAPDEWNAFEEATFGGYLVRDRLWFFLAGRRSETTTQRFTTRTNVPYSSTSDDTRGQVKLTANAGSHSLVLSWLRYQLDETNTLENPFGPLDPAALIPSRSTPATLVTAGYRFLTSRSVLLEGQYSGKRYALQRNGALSSDRIAGTFINVPRIGILNAPNSCGVCGDDVRDNDLWVAKANGFLTTRRGDHAWTAGLEDFREERRVNQFLRSASNFFIRTNRVQIDGGVAYPVFDAATEITWTPLIAPSRGSTLRTSSVFVHDVWSVTPRFTLSVGGRFDRNDARDADRTQISDAGAFSPRLAVSFDPRGDGAHRLSLSYGRYVGTIPEGPDIAGAVQRAGSTTDTSWTYRGPEINAGSPPQFVPTAAALAKLFAWFDSVGGIANTQYVSSRRSPGVSSIIPDSLQSPYVDELTAGYALQLGTRGFVRADFIAREWGNFYAIRLDRVTGQTRDDSGNVLDVNWLVNDDELTSRRYRAVHLQGAWNGPRVRLGGNYTWSRLRGNEDSEFDIASETIPNRPGPLYYPELLDYPRRRPVGFLPADQTHRLRAWLTWAIPLKKTDLEFALLQSYDSGRAWSMAGAIDASGVYTPYEKNPVNPGYALTRYAPTGYAYYFSDRGALRTEGVSSTDLAVNVALHASRALVFVQSELSNLFNRASVVAPNMEVLTRLNAGASSGLAAFNPFTETPVEGVHYSLPADFGRATGPSSYQTPRTFRASVGLKF